MDIFCWLGIHHWVHPWIDGYDEVDYTKWACDICGKIKQEEK